MLKSVLFVMVSILSLPVLADQCSVILQVVASDDRSRVARRDSQARCYQYAAASDSAYCLEPHYIGKVGSNNDAWATPLVITRHEGSYRRACQQAYQSCRQLARGRDWCEQAY